MSNAIRHEVRAGNTPVNVCNDCRAWEHEGRAIRHAKHCDTPLAQPAVKEEALVTPEARRNAANARRLSAAETKRRAREGSGLTDAEIFEAHRDGAITTSEAMNRDD